MGKLSSVSFQCGWIPDQQDYSIVVLPNAVRFDSNNSPNIATIKVNVFRVVDGARSALPVNSATGAKHWLLFVKTTATATTRTPVSSINASSLADAKSASFELVAKDDVTVSGSTYTYAETAIITSESIAIAHDGTQGAKSVNAFCRAKTEPTAPKGGSYAQPKPTTAGWSLTPPADSAANPMSLWMSTATFETTTTNQQNWSTPVLVADDTDIEFIFTPNTTPGTPDNTHPHPDNASDVGDGWGKNPVGAAWMAIAKKSGGAWEAWNVVRIKGEKGDDGVSYSLVLTPTSVHYDLNTQKYNPSTVTCRVLQTKGDNEVTDVTGNLPSGFAFKYSCEYEGAMLAEKVCNGTISFATSPQYGRLDFILKKGNVVVARETLSIVVNGLAGKAGPMTPPPAMWDEYVNPDGSVYEFQDGKTRVDGVSEPTRTDVVLWGTDADGKYLSWVCAQSHKKAADKEPKAGSKYWRQEQGGYDLFASKVILADNAFIGLLSGNAIRIYNSARSIVGQMSSIDKAPTYQGHTLPFFIGGLLGDTGSFSEEPRFAVDEAGRTYHGGVTGKHIEIDPGQKVINIFNEEGSVCATHSGRTIPVSDATEAVTSPSNCNKTVKVSVARRSDISTSKQTILGATTLTCAGSMTINVPAITMSGKVGDGSGPQSVDIGVMYLLVTVNGVERTRRLIGKLSYLGNLNDDDATISLAFSIQENFAKGDQVKVEVECQTFVKNKSGTSPGYFQASGGNVVTNFVASVYRCEFGANGFFLAQNTQNYMYFLFDTNGVLQIGCKANGVTKF